MENQFNSVRRYLDDFINRIVEALPALLGALLILIAGYFIAKAVQAALTRLLQRMDLDKRLHSTKGGGTLIRRALPQPAKIAGRIAFWVVFFVAISLAVSVLGIPALVSLVAAIYAYIPNVIAAIIIFLVAIALSAGIVTFVGNVMGDTPTGKVIASAGPIVVMGLATFMILTQLQIAKEIVIVTYGALIGSAGLSMALAFGLGGRGVAAKMLEELYAKGQSAKDTVAQDMHRGASETRRKADTVTQ